MKERELIRRVAQRARREAPPQVNVSGRVMAALETLPRNGHGMADPLAWLAAASAVGAAIVLRVAAGYGDTWADAFVASNMDVPWWLL